jgi:hypothetical protein
MVKEKTRSRGVVYLDSIDLEILEFLDKPNNNESVNGWGVLEIVKELNISHVSLKPHIDKLLRLDLITTITIGTEKSRTLLIIKPEYNSFMAEMGDVNKKEYSEMKQEKERFEIIINFLRRIRKLFYEEQRNKLLYIDLRRKPKENKQIKNSKKDTSKK